MPVTAEFFGGPRDGLVEPAMGQPEIFVLGSRHPSTVTREEWPVQGRYVFAGVCQVRGFAMYHWDQM